MLGYQRLDVYRCAVRLLALCARPSQDAPKGYGSLADQLRRASLSVPLNIAEGAGQPTSKSSARYFGIARGAAMECGAILDAFAAIGAGNPTDIDDGLALVVRIVEMLTKMCR